MSVTLYKPRHRDTRGLVILDAHGNQLSDPIQPRSASLLVDWYNTHRAEAGPYIVAGVPVTGVESAVVTERDLTVLRALLLESAGFGWEIVTESLITSMTDEYGWASGGPIIQWEEGPEEWAYSFGDQPEVAEYCRLRGLRVEAARHWVVSIYPA